MVCSPVRKSRRGGPLNRYVRPHVNSIAKPTIEILGAYQVDPSADLLAEAMRWKYPFEDMSPEERRAAQRAVREEIGSAVLFEVAVKDRDDRFTVDDFKQPDSDQAAYSEFFLSPQGTEVIARDLDVPDTRD